MIRTIDSFEVSFSDLFCSENPQIKVDFVKIPMIQRDYAQGRPDKDRMRRNFLNALYESIDKADSKPRVLDFVYGQRKKELTKDGCHTGKWIFEPIDGQQRLTTLFLLNLYVAKRIDRNDSFVWLRKFSYETRQSSRRFCEKLIEMPADAFTDINGFLKKQSWYTKRYQIDPTIKGMVRTLTDIASHYNKSFSIEELGNVWDNLQNNITFMLLYLKNLNTTDDLYIKMNSRGLHLTDFEKFKAELEGYLKDMDKSKDSDFSVKIDTSWTNLLWDYRNKNNDGTEIDFTSYDPDDLSPYTRNGLDEMFHHIFRRYMSIERCKANLKSIKRDGDNNIVLKNYSDNANDDLSELAEMVFGNDSKEARESRMLRLCKFMDCIYDACNSNGECSKEKVGEYFGQFLYTNTSNKVNASTKIRLFGGAAAFNTDLLMALASSSSDLDLGLTLIIEAFIEYSTIDITSDEFFERLRIVRNLIANTHLLKENMPSLLNRVDLIINKGDIGVDKTDFVKEQKKQEILKLRWIDIHSEFDADDILKMRSIENHDAIWGDMSLFIAKTFSNQNEGAEKPVLLTSYFDKFMKLFPDKDDPEMWMLRHQALMTLADYARKDGDLWLYAGDKKSLWRERVFTRVNESVHPFVLSLLDSESIDYSTDVKPGLEAMKKNYLAECGIEGEEAYPWRYYVVRYRGIQHGEDRKVYKDIGHEYRVVAYERTRANCKRWNPFLKRISKEPFMEGKTNLENYESKLELKIVGLRAESSDSEFILRPIITDSPEFSLPILQRNGLDAVDRIQLFLRFYQELETAFNLQSVDALNMIVEKYHITAYDDDKQFVRDLLGVAPLALPAES